MHWLRIICDWIWQRREQLLFVSHFLILIVGILGVVGLFIASQSFQLQSKAYEEESFNRQQGAISLAWRTIADANNNLSEIGQSNAVSYLIAKNSLDGKLTLNGTQLTLFQSVKEPMYMNFSRSNMCGANLYLSVASNSTIHLSNGIFRATRISGRLVDTFANGADFQGAYFDNVRAPRLIFLAADLRSSSFVGGSFEKADFQGADLRNIKSYRGHSGAGTTYDDSRIGGGYSEYGYFSPDSEYPVYFSENSDVSVWQPEVDLTNTNTIHLVDFRGARFLRADIRGADLTNTTINQTQVDEACADEATKLPSGLKLKNICVPETWISDRRKLIQRATYEGRIKAVEECDSAASRPIWK